ncbi:MAG: hypothetical protein MJ249_09760 [Kiritimatiellae bacterium]|nr:hypothetical protein [Kiritimatiellia bacterium]
MEMVAEYLTDLAIADCLATMRARMCVKRHGDVALDRYFKGVGRRSEGNVVAGAWSDDPAAYMPPRRLWSRIGLKARKKTDRAVYNKLAIMRHVRWVIENGKLDESEWGRRFSEFAARIRARVKRGDFNFEMPVSFAVEKPGKGKRFVTSFLNLEDKVILMAGTKQYLGRPASYCGFLKQVERPAVGEGRHRRVARLGYEGV